MLSLVLFVQGQLKRNLKSMVNQDYPFISSVSRKSKEAIESFKEYIGSKSH